MSKGAEWERIIEEQRGSGQSISKYCRERGISDKSISYWVKRLREGCAGEPEDRQRGFATVGAVAMMELVSPSGVRARVPVGTSAKDLRTVVEALRVADS